MSKQLAVGKKLLFVVSGPSGVGKSTLCQNILETVPDIRLSVSYTTRKPRANESEGKEYRFISQEEFEEKKAVHAFAEWAEVHGHLYGTPWSELEQNGQQFQSDILLDIDVQGAHQVMSTLKRAVSVFVLPPSLEVLWQRLSGRATDAPEEQQRRFQKAQDEMKHYPEYQYTIRNVNLEQAIWELRAVIMAERVRTVHLDPAQVFR
ncbi:MAG: guanylate kinase [Nitrospira sp.]|nr:guanylate kinase [Nitrospira sp.]MCA9465498.1 guanylate kinase [Nitrospira sp.]MCA9475073.1 guanylate kinase [Nitrospira sp.]MCA9479917.1 guanylate kinase [Nitrospira sp.]MDR4486092.1 guanylate kinase [Nitrospirales bacterium]